MNEKYNRIFYFVFLLCVVFASGYAIGTVGQSRENNQRARDTREAKTRADTARDATVIAIAGANSELGRLSGASISSLAELRDNYNQIAEVHQKEKRLLMDYFRNSGYVWDFDTGIITRVSEQQVED